ncbi:hypothetical protein pdam_00018468 [Pocillopora damicornis]|uniref:Uncharacterized protein n=1 Tax=Pocillopora damicornis TaxID=46731 RepID=A0A3M6UDV5_POCDA|nr:hypothetical protein pdam_00018468 [Pocillopora damicornis]
MNGMKGNQRKSDATIKVERPTDVSAVQRLLKIRFMGLVEFLFKSLEKLSEMREPLHRLTRRNASGSGLMSKTMLPKDQRRY